MVCGVIADSMIRFFFVVFVVDVVACFAGEPLPLLLLLFNGGIDGTPLLVTAVGRTTNGLPFILLLLLLLLFMPGIGVGGGEALECTGVEARDGGLLLLLLLLLLAIVVGNFSVLMLSVEVGLGCSVAANDRPANKLLPVSSSSALSLLLLSGSSLPSWAVLPTLGGAGVVEDDGVRSSTGVGGGGGDTAVAATSVVAAGGVGVSIKAGGS